MPELPEVETVARGVDARVRGQRIVEVWFASHRQPFKTPAARQARELEGRVFLEVHRVGKHIVCELSAAGFEAPGAEPLVIGREAFAALFRGRRLAIKAALLNQRLLAGVGNIYADESLFRAGIRPRRRAGRLSRAELERLRVELVRVLKEAIRLGGSSVSDYVDAEGAHGFFQLEHCVYQRTGLPCRKCGAPIRRVVVAGRGTHYCPQCQR